MSDWWAYFSTTRGPVCLALIAGMVGLGYFWPQPKKPAKPEPRPCSCDAYNGVICRNHAN